MSWYKIYVGKSKIGQGKHQEIIKLFKDIQIPYHSDMKEIALFSSNDIDSYFLYFTPFSVSISAIADLLQVYGAEKCHTPQKGSVTLIAGDPSALNLLR